MRTLTSHNFTNGKHIDVRFVEPDERTPAPEEDTLLLAFGTREKETKMFMRPDEAVLLIKLLSEAVYLSVEGYTIGLKGK